MKKIRIIRINQTIWQTKELLPTKNRVSRGSSLQGHSGTLLPPTQLSHANDVVAQLTGAPNDWIGPSRYSQVETEIWKEWQCSSHS